MRTILIIVLICSTRLVYGQSEEKIKTEVLNEFRLFTQADSIIKETGQSVFVEFSMFSVVEQNNVSFTKDSLTMEMSANKHVRVFRSNLFDMLIGNKQFCYVDHKAKQVFLSEADINTKQDFFQSSSEQLSIIQNAEIEIIEEDKHEYILKLIPAVKTQPNALDYIEVIMNKKTGRVKEYSFHSKVINGAKQSQHIVVHVLEIKKSGSGPKSIKELYQNKKGELVDAYQNYHLTQI